MKQLLLPVTELTGLFYRGFMTFRPYTKLTAVGVADARSNNTGATINKGQPTRINNSGELDFVNPAIEADAIGTIAVAQEEILDGSSGEVVTDGKIEDIVVSASLGDVVYVSKIGGLTSIQPSIGVGGFVAGDMVIQVGIIAKNEINASLKDLIVNIDTIGQL